MGKISPQLGRVVRKYRLAARLSQEELAHSAGLHRTYISLLERGLRNPTVDALEAIGAVLHVPASRLVAEAEQDQEGAP